MNDLQKYNVIGMMSGTSVDGLDIAYSEYTVSDEVVSFNILASRTYPYESEFAQRLIDAIHVNAEELLLLDLELGNWIGKRVLEFQQETNTTPQLIASHGHTIFHQPDRGLTVQIGDGQKIHQLTRIPVVYNFRVLDVHHGGQGAPLVPIGDQLLFGDYAACVNIGGFANLSFEAEGRRAYDICATNIVLNELTQLLGRPYDNGGEIAAAHSINQDLLDALGNVPFYNLPFPKSLGKEWVEETIKPILQAHHKVSTGDQIATYTHHMAKQIARSISDHTPDQSKVLFTGGGAFNTFLVNTVNEMVARNIIVPDPVLVNYKEAVVFGLMGILRMLGRHNCLASVTGASQNTSGGTLIGSLG